MLDYLDRLRDLLWEDYSEDIIEQRTGEHDEDNPPDDQSRFEYEFGLGPAGYE